MTSMRIGNVTPTDVDGWFIFPHRLPGAVEFHRLSYWLHELKSDGKEMPWGQRRALECIADDLASAHRYVVLVLGIEPPGTDEFLPSQAKATICRHGRQWHTLPGGTTLQAAWDSWADSVQAIEDNRVRINPDGSISGPVFPFTMMTP